MSVEKRRKTMTPDVVPGLGDPDRKRVLNVLAQRRYRQRRKEKLAELEARTNAAAAPTREGTGPSSDSSSSPSEQWQDVGVEEVVVQSAAIDFQGLEYNPAVMDMSTFAAADFGFSTYPTPNDQSDYPSPIGPLATTSSLTNASNPAITFQFPLTPDANLEIPLLNTIRAFGLAAQALNIDPHLGDPTYLHVLPPTGHNPSIPANLQPLPCQFTIPHHPALDIVPWPSVREKLICMFSLPSHFRPEVAREEEGSHGQSTAIVKVLQDLDDSCDPVRNHGGSVNWGSGSELAEEAWELGQAFYAEWWWCVDRRVVERSNSLRVQRGLPRLRPKAK